MATLQLSAWSAALLCASISAVSAGPCSNAIDGMQARIDARLQATVAAGPMGAESTSARLHHQPTPGSIAAAEEKLGNMSADKVDAVLTAMARARSADDAGDKDACEQALAEVQQTIGP